MEKTVKILAHTRDDKYFGIGNSSTDIIEFCDTLTKKYNLNNNIAISNWWYLHGELQSIVGYDRGEILNYGELPHKLIPNTNVHFDLDTVMLEPGIYDVEVYGVNRPCIGYFWIDERIGLRGLVCLKSDIEGCKYAYENYIRKPFIIM